MTGHRFPLICFDLDGTLVDDTIYIWKTLHETLGTDSDARQRAYDDYNAGRISYRQWFEHDLELFDAAGANEARIRKVVDGLRPMSGAREVLRELADRGHRLAVVSGSLDIVVEQLFPEVGFDHVLINRLFFDGSGRIAGGEHTPYDLEGKADGLIEICRREGLSTAQAAFVGDNVNDVWIAKAAGRSVAFNCKSDELREVCDFEVEGKDLSRVLPLISPA